MTNYQKLLKTMTDFSLTIKHTPDEDEYNEWRDLEDKDWSEPEISYDEKM